MLNRQPRGSTEFAGSVKIIATPLIQPALNAMLLPMHVHATILALLLALALPLSYAQGQEPPGDEGSERLNEAQTLYERGLKRMKRGYYEDAIVLFDQVSNRYPLSRVAALAELRVADCFFENGDYLAAVDAYTDFQTLHPGHEEVPYASFRVGASYMKLAPLQPALDLTDVTRAVAVLSRFPSRFPESPLVEEANKFSAQGNERLARKEAQVGNFYFRTKEWSASARRYLDALEGWPQVRHRALSTAALRLALCSVWLDDTQTRDLSLAVLQERYPDSRALRTVHKRIERTTKKRERQRDATVDESAVQARDAHAVPE